MKVLIGAKFVERPVVEAGSTDDILDWERTPHVGVVAVISVVAHHKHLQLRHQAFPIHILIENIQDITGPP